MSSDLDGTSKWEEGLSACKLSHPALVALVALSGYLFLLVAFMNNLGDARDFILIGKEFITQSNKSSAIQVDPSYHYLEETNGYDGQFAYFIALDPVNARYYVDRSRISYRYTRILYPMVARLLALGNRDGCMLNVV